MLLFFPRCQLLSRMHMLVHSVLLQVVVVVVLQLLLAFTATLWCQVHDGGVTKRDNGNAIAEPQQVHMWCDAVPWQVQIDDGCVKPRVALCQL